MLRRKNNICRVDSNPACPSADKMIQIFNLYPFPFIITFNQFVEYIEIV